MLQFICKRNDQTTNFPSNLILLFQFFAEKEDKNGEIRRELQIDPHLRCVPFRQCSAFMWILANTRKIRNINAAKLFQIAEKKMCDVDELVLNSNLTLDSRIACPEVSDESDEPVYDLDEINNLEDQNYVNYVEDYEYLTEDENEGELLIERRIHDLLREEQKPDSCIGSLEFYHGPSNSPLNDIQILRLSQKWKEIGNVKKLKQIRVLRLKAEGNCCWKIYQNQNFSGRYEHIHAGYDKYPRIKFQSLKKFDC